MSALSHPADLTAADLTAANRTVRVPQGFTTPLGRPGYGTHGDQPNGRFHMADEGDFLGDIGFPASAKSQPPQDLPARGLSGEAEPDSTLAPDPDQTLESLGPEPEAFQPEDPDPQGTGGFWQVLQNRNFLSLWSGQVFSQLADKVFLVLVVALISSHFQGTDESISGWVSLVMVAFTVPAILFGSIAGVYVDRWPKKLVMVLTNVVRGILVVAIPFLLWLSQDWAPFARWPIGFLSLLLVTFLVSTLTQFFAPAEQTTIPLIVSKRHLLSANSLYTTTMMASVIVGFAIGEPMLAFANHLLGWIQPGSDIGAELVVGGGYIVAGILLLLMRTGERERPATQVEAHWLADLQEGWDYLRQARLVRSALIQLITLFCIFAALAVLAVRLAELIPALKASQFGFLLAAAGVGLALGALVVGHWGSRLRRGYWSLLGLTGMAISLGLLAMTTTLLWPSMLLIGVLGFAGALVGVPMQTLIQEETPQELRGKVFGLQNNFTNIALSLPLALASVAETRFGLPPVIWGLAAIATLTGLITWSTSQSPPPGP